MHKWHHIGSCCSKKLLQLERWHKKQLTAVTYEQVFAISDYIFDVFCSEPYTTNTTVTLFATFYLFFENDYNNKVFKLQYFKWRA